MNAFIGILVILIGSWLIWIALQFAYKSDESRKMLAAAIAIWIFGGAVTVHGLFFALTGTWFVYAE
jgi:hypothetical protein